MLIVLTYGKLCSVGLLHLRSEVRPTFTFLGILLSGLLPVDCGSFKLHVMCLATIGCSFAGGIRMSGWKVTAFQTHRVWEASLYFLR